MGIHWLDGLGMQLVCVHPRGDLFNVNRETALLEYDNDSATFLFYEYSLK
jgi:hypothetical protein